MGTEDVHVLYTGKGKRIVHVVGFLSFKYFFSFFLSFLETPKCDKP